MSSYQLVGRYSPATGTQSSASETLQKFPGWLARRIKLWVSVSRERRMLQNLDDHMLRDIGVSRADAVREGERAFWDLPHDLREGK